MKTLASNLLAAAEERYPRHLAVAVPEVVIRKDALEYFVTLLIEECINCCETVISDPVRPGVDNWLNGGKQCIEEIKYRFSE